MEVDYYSKYLKYKAKYLELKAQLGAGGSIGCHNEITICKHNGCGIACKKKGCICLSYEQSRTTKNCICKHPMQDHWYC